MILQSAGEQFGGAGRAIVNQHAHREEVGFGIPRHIHVLSRPLAPLDPKDVLAGIEKKRGERSGGFDTEVYEYYEARPELEDLIRFGVSVRSFIHQRDAEPLGIENVYEAQYGMEGLERVAPLRTLHEKGIPFHIEGGGPQSPLIKIQQAVTRIDEQGRVIAEHESIDRKVAFLALTRWAARFIGADNVMGSIQTGYLADLVVFDGNILDVPIENIHELKPVMTLVGGQVAFESNEL